jgi:hypothetical protein
MAVRPPPQAAPRVLEVRPRRRHAPMVGRGSAVAERATGGGGRLFQGGALVSGGSAANQAILQTCMRSGGGRGP